MLNYIWAAMIALGIVFGAVNGNMKEVTEAALDSAGEAVSLCIAMAGIMALWVGLMEVAESAGLIRRLTNMLSPFVSFMFPGLPKKHKARDYISMNIIANILGLGWACTPAGLKAMEELAKLEVERGTPGYAAGGKGILADERKGQNRAGKNGGELSVVTSGKSGRIASNEMCTFLILNISSLQLIPVNMIAYRQQYGSVNPAGIIAPAIVATFISTLVAVVYCKMKDSRKRRE
ncbi:nucleoside recognition protein [Parablautia intestinalis]|uniref:Nucleoside recognition protein n=2 Tax=Parablautia intestinalis TaxID=2320100 RepID=A0A3A9A755_9FIRM|nr:nucleoside recognition protein [Parablautia intestinalis]RKI87462.1 nucleoside recognition protein [Parablautia intestinalis]